MILESKNRLPAPIPTIDQLLHSLDQALRTLTGSHQARRASPASVEHGEEATLRRKEHSNSEPNALQLSAALMRVNHVGEVCAQALYSAQSLTARTAALREHFDAAAREEIDHLVWTEQRLKALNSRTSLLNPLWYAGAFGIGLVAGALGARASLGFVIETERQVEAHLASHLKRLPDEDLASQAIVRQMQEDEARHAEEAAGAGGVRPPLPVRWLMKAAAKVMTASAHHI